MPAAASVRECRRAARPRRDIGCAYLSDPCQRTGIRPPMTSQKPSFSDKLLPTAPANRDLFAGPEASLLPCLYDAIIAASGIVQPHDELTLQLSDRFTVEEMGSN